MPAGAPTAPCEQQQWLELAPAQVAAIAQTSYQTGNMLHVTTYDQSSTGIGVFHLNAPEPMSTSDAMRAFNAPALRPTSEAKIQSIAKRDSLTSVLRVGGLVAAGAGMGVFVASGSDSIGAAAGLAGAGLVMELIALFTQPGPFEQSYLQVRERVFIEEETDMPALANAVDAANQKSRSTCAARGDR